MGVECMCECCVHVWVLSACVYVCVRVCDVSLYVCVCVCACVIVCVCACAYAHPSVCVRARCATQGIVRKYSYITNGNNIDTVKLP